MLILNIETSSKFCSVALHNNGLLINSFNVYTNNSHSKYLLPLINKIFDFSDYIKEDLQAVCVSNGPGSFTGLRVGLSTAKGICYGLDIPIIALDSLSIMVSQVENYNFFENFLFCPTIDFGKTEIFYSINNLKDHSQISKNEVIDEKSFEGFFKSHKVLFFGTGITKIRETVKNSNAFFVENIYPSAKYMIKKSIEKYKKREFENLKSLEPFYGRSPKI